MKSTTALLFFGLIFVAVNAKRGIFPEISPRITNGLKTDRNQFPYQVYIQDPLMFCGGSVISNEWILTAAHCVKEAPDGVDVFLGAWNASDDTEIGQQRFYVLNKDIIVHKDWNTETLKNDIALVKLPKPIEFNEYIQPINIPKIRWIRPYPTYADEKAIVAGWGQLSDVEYDYPDMLQWVEVPIMSNSACEPYYNGIVRDSNICIQVTDGKSSCHGDSGGPLVVGGDKPLLIGVASFVGSGGCLSGAPGVYTRVTSYLRWIKEHSGIVGH